VTTDDDVGLAFALGDYGAAPEAFEKLNGIMERFGETDTGGASALVIANSAGRAHRDVRADSETRSRDDKLVDRALEVAVKDRPAEKLASLAAAVVSPVEPQAPVLGLVRDRIAGDDYSADDTEEAEKILDDHMLQHVEQP
jgi:hypothetical protein